MPAQPPSLPGTPSPTSQPATVPPEPHQLPRNSSGLLALAFTTIIKSRTGRVIAALFVLTEIYIVSIGPVWLQSAELRKKWAELHVAQAEASASLKKLTAEADKAEHEAEIAEQTGVAAPELEAAIAREITEKGNVLAETAKHARDLAKTDADKMEAEAHQSEAKAYQLKETAAANIERQHQEAIAKLKNIAVFIGLPIPTKLRFDPRNPNG